jgi:hypothetical protein
LRRSRRRWIGSFILGAAAARGISPLIAVDIDEGFERRNSRCGDRDRRNLADIVLDRVIALADLVDGGIRPLAERTARGKIIVDTQPA